MGIFTAQKRPGGKDDDCDACDYCQASWQYWLNVVSFSLAIIVACLLGVSCFSKHGEDIKQFDAVTGSEVGAATSKITTMNALKLSAFAIVILIVLTMI